MPFGIVGDNRNDVDETDVGEDEWWCAAMRSANSVIWCEIGVFFPSISVVVIINVWF